MTQLPALEKSHLSCTDVGCKNFYNNFKEIHVCVLKGCGGTSVQYQRNYCSAVLEM